jgi:predicted PurR-regulated permease PerM
MTDPSDHWRRFWLVVALALAGVVALTVFRFLGTFVLGVFLYYASRPMYVRLHTRIKRPGIAAAAALLLLALPVVLLFWYTVSVGLDQLGAISDLDLAGFQDFLAPYLRFVDEGGSASLYERLVTNPAQLLEDGRVREAVSTVLSAASEFAGVFLSGLINLFIALAVAYYLLKDGHRLADWIRDTVGNETLTEYGRNVDADLQTVFFGNILTALLTGLIGAVVFWGLAAIAPPEVGLPVPILLGLLVGAASLIPVVGMKIVLLPMTVYLTVLAVTAGAGLLWFPVVFFAVTTVFVDFIPDLLLRPYVSGRDLHVGLVMFAYVLGPLLFGWYGIFLGPLLLVLVIHFGRIVVPYLVADGEPPGGGTSDESVSIPKVTVGDPDQWKSGDSHDEYDRIRSVNDSGEA